MPPQAAVTVVTAVTLFLRYTGSLLYLTFTVTSVTCVTLRKNEQTRFVCPFLFEIHPRREQYFIVEANDEFDRRRRRGFAFSQDRQQFSRAARPFGAVAHEIYHLKKKGRDLLLAEFLAVLLFDQYPAHPVAVSFAFSESRESFCRINVVSAAPTIPAEPET